MPNLAKHEPFADPDRLVDFIERMNRISGVSIEHDLRKWPRTQLVDLDESVDGFLRVWDWYLDEIAAQEFARDETNPPT